MMMNEETVLCSKAQQLVSIIAALGGCVTVGVQI